MTLRWFVIVVVLCLGMLVGAVLRPGMVREATAETAGDVGAVALPRYELVPVVVDKGDKADRFLIDTWEGRVWVWPAGWDREFIPVPVREPQPE